MMDAPELDLTRICRACKCESLEMHQLFEGIHNNIESPRIDEMLMACTSIQMNSSDGLPSLICKECKEKVEYAYTFKQQCQMTDISLREYAKKVKKDPDVTDNFLNDLQQMLESDTEKNTDVKLEDMTATEMESTVQKCDFIEIMDNNQLVLTCRQCFKVFSTLDGLKCHKRLHSGALYKCKTCDKEYTRLNHLQRHELSHGRKKVHVCKICNKTLTRFEHLKRHLVTHLKEKPYSCEKCNRGFNRTEHLLNHAERCKGDRIHICDICNKGFNRADSLEVHRKLHENKMPILPTLENLDNIDEHYIEIDYDESYNSVFDMYDDELDGDEADLLEPQIHLTENAESFEECNIEPIDDNDVDLNDDNFKNETNPKDSNILQNNTNEISDGNEFLQDSTEFNTPDVENDTDSGHSEYTPTKITRKIKRGRGRPRKLGLKRGRPPKVKVEIKEEEEFEDEEGEFSCLVCNEMFTKLSLLDVHAATHAGVKVFECKTCQKTFSRSTHLKRHMLSHSEIKPYSCDICTKSFIRRDHLTQHMKLHSRALEFECDICQRTFARVDHLTKHQLAKHNQGGDRVIAEKRFKCSVCSKGFTTEKYRDVHMKAHNGEKKYQCKTCDKTFLSKSHLTEHMKFHSDHSKKFLCSECGQRFIRNDYLIIHMRRHRGEKPFKCKFCGKGFPRTTDLTVHERYHTGEKTHLCVICGRGFGRAYNLTVHMRTHTGEKPYQCTYCQAAFAQGNDLKAHIRRHTGERFQCELCTETFLMGYLLTQHKRQIHGLNVVSNIRRLQTSKPGNPDDPEPITISLPAPVVPSSVNVTQIQAQLAIQLQAPIAHE